MQIKIPKPVCARCGKKVEVMSVTESFGLDGLLVTVKCHGKTDTCVLRYEALQNANKILPGQAFKPTR